MQAKEAREALLAEQGKGADRLRDQLAAKDMIIADKTKEVADKAGEVKEKDKEIASLSRDKVALERSIASLKAEKEKSAADLCGRKDKEIASLEAKVKKVEGERDAVNDKLKVPVPEPPFPLPLRDACKNPRPAGGTPMATHTEEVRRKQRKRRLWTWRR